MGKVTPSSHTPSGSFVQYAPVQERFVMLWSWWHSPKSGRKFAVVEKLQKGDGNQRKTTAIKLLELDDSNPFQRDIEEFWRLVDEGKLVEYCHDAIGRTKEIN